MRTSKYRWFVVFVFFWFVLLHQADKLLISPLTTPIMDTFGINEAQMGAVSSLALLVAAILYPVWGYAYVKRGYETAVLAHTLSDWLPVLLFM